MKVSPRKLWAFRIVATAFILHYGPPVLRQWLYRTTTPVTRPFDDWHEAHTRHLRRASQGGIDLLFLGDSITANWVRTGERVFQEVYAPMKAAAFGIDGDRTQHLLWRITNGELAGVTARVMVVLIGSNNCLEDEPADIVEGVAAILREIHARCPRTRVLLLGLFPRDHPIPNPVHERVLEVNRRLPALANGTTIRFLDIGERFLQNGQISPAFMPDFVHPSEAAYRVWVRAMAPTLQQMLR
jgi:lysophospholipase L1-like esterase